MKKGFLFFSAMFVASFAFGYGYENETINKYEEKYSVETIEKKEESELNVQNYNIVEQLEIEINSKMPTMTDYINESLNGTIKYYKDNVEINEKDVLKNVGQYNVLVNIDYEDYTSVLVVKDTEKPKLTLKSVSINKGNSYNINTFVKTCTDNSGMKCELSFKKSQMANYKNAGTYEIIVVAKDKSGNETEVKTQLIIKENTSNKVNITSNKTNTKKANNNINPSTNKYKEQAKNLISVNTTDVKKILDLTNQYRKEKNVKALKLDNSLCQAANLRALEMAYNDYFAHARPNGDSYWSILNDLNISRKSSGENIARGYESAEEVSQAWKDSKGHYLNMINSEYNYIGIGEYTLNGITYHVQIFANK